MGIIRPEEREKCYELDSWCKKTGNYSLTFVKKKKEPDIIIILFYFSALKSLETRFSITFSDKQANFSDLFPSHVLPR